MKAPTPATARYPSGWMGSRCLRWLERQAVGATLMAEVGSWKGRSATALARGLLGTLYCIDRWPDDTVYRAFTEHLADEIHTGRVVPLRMDSGDGASELLRLHGRRSFDFVFIDADHSYAGASADIEAYRPLVRPGGTLAGHDFSKGWPGVKRAVHEAFGAGVCLGPGSIWSVQL